LHVVSFEGDSTEKHSVETDTQTPDIRGETLVARAMRLLATDEDLWGDVGRSATLLCHNFILRVLEKARDTEVTKFEGDLRGTLRSNI
jgi:hypothetical protein